MCPPAIHPANRVKREPQTQTQKPTLTPKKNATEAATKPSAINAEAAIITSAAGRRHKCRKPKCDA